MNFNDNKGDAFNQCDGSQSLLPLVKLKPFAMQWNKGKRKSANEYNEDCNNDDYCPTAFKYNEKTKLYSNNQTYACDRIADEDIMPSSSLGFKSARVHFLQNRKEGLLREESNDVSPSIDLYGSTLKTLGASKELPVAGKRFKPPVRQLQDSSNSIQISQSFCMVSSTTASNALQEIVGSSVSVDDRLKSIDPKLIELIVNEVIECDQSTTWDDIAGLDYVKRTIIEVVVKPMIRPDIFTGLLAPPKGILLFGPPGTGKTLIGKCIACQSKATFFNISASSLMSKWVGEGEKLVRALFAVAKCRQPAVVFIDEIDSILAQRSDTEHECSRRVKTEFFVQLDGVRTSKDERILIVGATNRPQEIDDAARRRLVKRLYVPLPDYSARKMILKNLLNTDTLKHSLTEVDLDDIVNCSEGYSGADVSNLCKEAAMGPIRSVNDIENVKLSEIRSIDKDDFLQALQVVKSSVSESDLHIYEEWNEKFGATFK